MLRDGVSKLWGLNETWVNRYGKRRLAKAEDNAVTPIGEWHTVPLENENTTIEQLKRENASMKKEIQKMDDAFYGSKAVKAKIVAMPSQADQRKLKNEFAFYKGFYDFMHDSEKSKSAVTQVRRRS